MTSNRLEMTNENLIVLKIITKIKSYDWGRLYETTSFLGEIFGFHTGNQIKQGFSFFPNVLTFYGVFFRVLKGSFSCPMFFSVIEIPFNPWRRLHEESKRWRKKDLTLTESQKPNLQIKEAVVLPKHVKQWFYGISYLRRLYLNNTIRHSELWNVWKNLFLNSFEDQ